MYEQIIAMLHKHKGKYRQIAAATGLDYDWLTQVSQRRIADPGIKKMEKLSEHLQQLEADAT